MQHFLITGANRGLGFEMVRQLLERQEVHIFATCREPEKATALRQLARPDRLAIIPLEVTDQAEIDTSAQIVGQYTDSLDVLINNAGILPSGQALEVITTEMMLKVLHTNAVAPLMIVKAYLGLLKKGQNPRLVNISSQRGSMDHERLGGSSYAYATSKAALNMITLQLAGDLGRAGITTITVHPGWVQTDMGGRSATLPADTAAQGVLKVIDNLSPRDNGRFFKWNGEQHAW